MDSILEPTMKGGADRKLRTMAIMIVSIATKRFCILEKGNTSSEYIKNCRAEKIAEPKFETATVEEAVQGGK